MKPSNDRRRLIFAVIFLSGLLTKPVLACAGELIEIAAVQNALKLWAEAPTQLTDFLDGFESYARGDVEDGIDRRKFAISGKNRVQYFLSTFYETLAEVTRNNPRYSSTGYQIGAWPENPWLRYPLEGPKFVVVFLVMMAVFPMEFDAWVYYALSALIEFGSGVHLYQEESSYRELWYKDSRNIDQMLKEFFARANDWFAHGGHAKEIIFSFDESRSERAKLKERGVSFSMKLHLAQGETTLYFESRGISGQGPWKRDPLLRLFSFLTR